MNTAFAKAVFEHGFTSFVITNGTRFWWAEPCSEGFCQPKGPSNAEPPPESPSCNTLEEKLSYCKSWAGDKEEVNAYCGPDLPDGNGGPATSQRATAYCPKILIDHYRRCHNTLLRNCSISVTEMEFGAAQQEIKDQGEKVRRRSELDAVKCTASDPRSRSEQESDPKCIERPRRRIGRFR